MGGRYDVYVRQLERPRSGAIARSRQHRRRLMADRAEHHIAQPQLQVTDDLGLLLEVLPARIRQPIEEMPDQAELLEVVMDLGRLPEARLPGRELILSHDVVTRRGPRLRHRADRRVRRRQPRRHRADAAPHLGDPQPRRAGRRADLPRRAGGLRHDRDHPRPGRVRARAS